MNGHQTASRRSLKRLVTHVVTTRSDQELLLQYNEDIPTLTHLYTQEHKDFWATYRWDENPWIVDDNPWIVDDKGRMLSTKSYSLLHACTLAKLHIRRVIPLGNSIWLPSTGLTGCHTLPKLGLWATAILMASPYLHEGEGMQIPAQLTLRDGPEVLTEYKWTFISHGVTHGRHHAHDRGNLAFIVLYQASNGDVSKHDQLELVQLQQRTRNTGLVFTAHPKLHWFP